MKTENQSHVKKCCLFSHLCNGKEEEMHICCSFCKKVDCDIRCCDSIESCKFIMTPEEFKSTFSGSRHDIDLKEYSKYEKTYPHRKEDLKLIEEFKEQKEPKKRGPKPKPKEEKKVTIPPTETKRGRGRPPKETKIETIETSAPIKRGRGRPPKNIDAPKVDEVKTIKRGRGRPPKKGV